MVNRVCSASKYLVAEGAKKYFQFLLDEPCIGHRCFVAVTQYTRTLSFLYRIRKIWRGARPLRPRTHPLLCGQGVLKLFIYNSRVVYALTG